MTKNDNDHIFDHESGSSSAPIRPYPGSLYPQVSVSMQLAAAPLPRLWACLRLVNTLTEEKMKVKTPAAKVWLLRSGKTRVTCLSNDNIVGDHGRHSLVKG